jgi:hypothetical protein
VADLIGVAGAGAEPQRQVTAQVGPDAGHRQPGGGQQPPVPWPSAGPGRQRAEEQGGRAGLAYRVHQADPLLVPVQRRPVGQPGGRRGHHAGHPGANQHAGRPVGAAEQVEQDRRRPAAQRQPDDRGMGRLAERNAVQSVGPGARGQRLDDGIRQLADHRIERMRPLYAFGQAGRLGQQGGLASLTCPPGGDAKGLPHVYCVPLQGRP